MKMVNRCVKSVIMSSCHLIKYSDWLSCPLVGIVKRLGLGLGTWDLGHGTWDLGPGT